MRWSKASNRLYELLIPELSKRFRVFLTTYEHSGGGSGRGWVAFDGTEIASFAGEVTSDSEGPRQRFYLAVSTYPDLPLDEILTNENEIIRGFGFLDRRVGAKRFETLTSRENLTEFEQRMIAVRREVSKR